MRGGAGQPFPGRPPVGRGLPPRVHVPPLQQDEPVGVFSARVSACVLICLKMVSEMAPFILALIGVVVTGRRHVHAPAGLVRALGPAHRLLEAMCENVVSSPSSSTSGSPWSPCCRSCTRTWWASPRSSGLRPSWSSFRGSCTRNGGSRPARAHCGHRGRHAACLAPAIILCLSLTCARQAVCESMAGSAQLERTKVIVVTMLQLVYEGMVCSA